MNTNRKKQAGLLLIVVMIAGLLAFATGGDVARADSAPVLPPHSSAFGKTYAEWAAMWWQWATDLPADENHPLIADGPMDCSIGQEGKVWFLGGSYAPGTDPDNVTEPLAFLGEANRQCEVPVGKALFFPIVNVLCSPLVGDFPPPPLLECPLNPVVEYGLELQVTPLSVSIDGVAVENLEDYFTLSEEPFMLGPLPGSLPEDNILHDPDHPEWALPGAEGEGATGGYYLMLPPLSKGEHDIKFEGQSVIPEIYSFRLDITYVLDVK